MTIDLEKMSIEQLDALISEAEQQRKKKVDEQRKDAIARMKEIADEVGLRFEISGEKRARKTTQKASPKYQNPQNPQEVWSGRGRQPHWVREALEAGASLDDLQI